MLDRQTTGDPLTCVVGYLFQAFRPSRRSHDTRTPTPRNSSSWSGTATPNATEMASKSEEPEPSVNLTPRCLSCDDGLLRPSEVKQCGHVPSQQHRCVPDSGNPRSSEPVHSGAHLRR